MGIWTVFEPDDDRTDASPARAMQRRAEGIVFVRETFSWLSLFFAPLVLLRHRLWLALLAYVVAQGLIGGALAWFDIADDAGMLTLIPNLLVALELPALRRRKLARNGFEEVGTVVARNLEAAESRFFGGWLPPARAAVQADAQGGWPATSPASPVLGLFPEMGRR